MSTSNQMAENLLEAMRTLVDKSVAEAGFDRTVEAQIVSYEDSKAGKYKIKYQGEYFYAFSDNTEVVYSEGTTVYVLFPGNSKTAQKTIVGSVKNLGTSYISVLSDSDKYIDIGTSIITKFNTASYELCSYKPQEILLYEHGNSSSLIEIDQQKVKEYLSEADAIRIKADFKTALPAEQQTRGNYGLSIFIKFKSDINKDEPIYKEYKIDVNNMMGNPYALTDFTTQELLSELDSSHFIQIEKIIFYVDEFPKTADGKPNDIFLKDFEIFLTNSLSDEELNGYYLKLVTKRGTTLTDIMVQTNKFLPIEAFAMLKGQELTHSSQDEYYWFRKNPSVGPMDLKYHQKGGFGWECLNTFQVTEREDPNDEQSEIVAGAFQPATNILNIDASMALTYKNEFKCVAIVDGVTISKEFIIFNDACQYNFSIFSPSLSSDIHKKTDKEIISLEKLTDGEFQEYLNIYNEIIDDNKPLKDKLSIMTELNNTYEETTVDFLNDVGDTSLICSLNGLTEAQLEKIHFIWSITDIQGKTSVYTEDQERISQINNCLAQIVLCNTTIEKGECGTIEEAKKQKNEEMQRLSTLRSILHVEGNRFFPVSAATITDISTFSCGVYDDANNLLGSASIKITNKEAVADYTLIINNGTQVFQYTEAGIAPNSPTLKNPMILDTLTFDIIDKNGNKFTEEAKKASHITWSIPITNTLLTLPKDKTSIATTEDGYALFSDMLILDYGIASAYKVNCSNQNIILSVVFKDKVLTAQTNFSFIKTGEPGSNGTDFIAKLIPNKKITGATIRNDYILLKKTRIASESEVERNIFSIPNGVWALPELYHNGTLIFDSSMIPSGKSTEGEDVTIKWSILKNSYAAGFEDFQPFSIDSQSGVISINETLLTGKDMNILNTHGINVETWENQLNDNVILAKNEYDASQAAIDEQKQEIITLQWLIEITIEAAKKQEYEIQLAEKTEELNNILIPANLAKKKEYNKAVGELETYQSYLTETISSSLATIIKVEILYKGIVYSDTIPVMIVDILDDTAPLNIELDNGGFLYGMYTSDGRRSAYDCAEPFTLYGTYGFNNEKDKIEDIKIQEGDKVGNNKFSAIWDTIGTVAEKIDKKWQWIEKCSLEEDNKKLKKEEKDNFPFYQKWIKPKDTYDGQCVTNMVRIIIKDEEAEKEIAVCYIPVYLLLNKYGNAAINGWDGNGIELNEESGVILAPQMGAGKKESDNSFTGVVMGTENIEGTESIGLLGYNHGERTIFLDAESGKAEFGKNNGGKIIIDPSSDKALIYSGNYKQKQGDNPGSGMQIDLTTPEIRFGTENFTVNANGDLTAKTGQIGGWDIRTNQLSSCEGKVGMRAYDKDSEEKDKQYAFWAGDQDPSKANFRVQYDGSTVVDNLRISSTDKENNRVVIDNGSIYSEKYNRETGTWIAHDTYISNLEGFFIGANGISVGGGGATNEASGENEHRGFSVNSKGDILATSGKIGGWLLTESGLSGGKKSLNDTSDGIFICNNGIAFGDPFNEDGTRKDIKHKEKNVFSVDSAGKLYSISGLIGGWTITSDTLSQRYKGANVGLSSKCYDIQEDGTEKENFSLPSIWSGGTVSHIIGKEEVVKGPKFFVDFQGNVYAKEAHIDGMITSKSGTIGGWIIGGTSLSSADEKLILNSEGSIKGGTTYTWQITKEGNATFNDINCTGKFSGAASGTFGGSGSGTFKSGIGGYGLNSNGFTMDGVGGWSIHSGSSIGTDAEVYVGSLKTTGSILVMGKDSTTVDGVSITAGGIKVHGTDLTKDRVIPTKNYGLRAFGAYETAEAMFGDCGTGYLGEDGKCYLPINPIFLECIDRKDDIRIFLTPYGKGEIYYNEKDSLKDILLIQGTPNLKFSWEIKFIQIGQGNKDTLRFDDINYNNTYSNQNQQNDNLMEQINIHLNDIEGEYIL